MDSMLSGNPYSLLTKHWGFCRVSLNTGKWDPVGEVAVGVLTGFTAGMAVGAFVGGMPVMAALMATITVGYAATKAGEAYFWPLLQSASKLIPDSFWDHYFGATDQIVNIVNSLFGNARNWTAPCDPPVLDLDHRTAIGVCTFA